MVPLTYLSNLWRTLEMALINCKISLQLKWSRNCIIVAETAIDQSPGFQTLSTHENIKLLKQLESGFEITMNWNKYLAKTANKVRKRYLDYLIDQSISK